MKRGVGRRYQDLSIEIPLPEIGGKDFVHIHVGASQEDTRFGPADDPA